MTINEITFYDCKNVSKIYNKMNNSRYNGCTSISGALAVTMGTGGLGLLAVGASVNQEDDEISYDCWKPVVHDTSPERSNGMLLKDMVCHPNVANVTMTTSICDGLPNIIIENIWNETFEIEYVFIHSSGKIACHAKHL
jgi:hypothetical protein